MVAASSVPVLGSAQPARQAATGRSVPSIEIQLSHPHDNRLHATIEVTMQGTGGSVRTAAVAAGSTVALPNGDDTPAQVLLHVQLTGFAHVELANLVVCLAHRLEPPSSVGHAPLAIVRSPELPQAPHGRSSGPRDQCDDGGLGLRIKGYVQQRLNDSDLSAAQIARAHNISVRSLYKVLERMQLPLGEWIRQQRLEACAEALRSPAADRQTIAAIAHQAGFGDLTHFARVFRRRYGLSPSEYRALVRQHGAR